MHTKAIKLTDVNWNKIDESYLSRPHKNSTFWKQHKYITWIERFCTTWNLIRTPHIANSWPQKAQYVMHIGTVEVNWRLFICRWCVWCPMMCLKYKFTTTPDSCYQETSKETAYYWTCITIRRLANGRLPSHQSTCRYPISQTNSDRELSHCKMSNVQIICWQFRALTLNGKTIKSVFGNRFNHSDAARCSLKLLDVDPGKVSFATTEFSWESKLD